MMRLSLFFFTLSLFSSQPLLAEEAPEAEYPYPSKRKIESSVEKPVKVDSKGAYYYDTSQPKKKLINIKGVQKPKKVDSSGAYYYGTEKKKDYSYPDDVEKPIDSDESGSYYYKRNKKKQKKTKDALGNFPSKVLKDGTFIYDKDEEELQATTSTIFVRAGVYGPPNVQGGGDLNFKDVYGDKSAWIINVEYEWKMFDFLGEFLFKIGSGLSITEGSGRFLSNNNNGLEPREKFQFILFPNTAVASYKFQIYKRQYITPYVDAGLGYFAFWERRTDDGKNSFGGAPVALASGGILISLSAFSSGTDLNTDYGATEMWLDLQLRQILGIDSRKDFTGTQITGGFALGF